MNPSSWREELQAAVRDIDQARAAVAEAGEVCRLLIVSCAREVGSVTRAAEQLGLSRQTVHRHLQRSTATAYLASHTAG